MVEEYKEKIIREKDPILACKQLFTAQDNPNELAVCLSSVINTSLYISEEAKKLAFVLAERANTQLKKEGISE